MPLPVLGLLSDAIRKNPEVAMNFGLGLMAQSGPSPVPTNLGASVGKAALGAQQYKAQLQQRALQDEYLKSQTGLAQARTAHLQTPQPKEYSPTEMGKLIAERESLARRYGEDDPRVRTYDARIKYYQNPQSERVPGIAGVVGPILAKKARDEELSPGEQQVLDLWARPDPLEQMMAQFLGLNEAEDPQAAEAALRQKLASPEQMKKEGKDAEALLAEFKKKWGYLPEDLDEPYRGQIGGG